MHNRHLTTWFLILLALLQRIQAAHIENCHEYCLRCAGRHSYSISNVSIEGRLEVSFQLQNEDSHMAQISLKGAIPETYIIVYRKKVTLKNGAVSKSLQVSQPQYTSITTVPGNTFHWTSVVLDVIEPSTLLVYTPENRFDILKTNVVHSSIVSVSSDLETHVMFNCLSGCIIRNSFSVLVRRNAILRPPFTMHLNRIETQNSSTTPMLVLTSNREKENVSEDASQWKAGVWHRVDFLLGKNNTQQGEWLSQGEDLVKKVIKIPNITYSLTLTRGLQWTLYCTPEELIENLVPSAIPDPATNTTETPATTTSSESDQGAGGTEGDDSNTAAEQKAKAGAGAGEVTAWVMAGLALFLVMVLALALCTKTARQSPPPQFHDSQPSVGMIYCKNAFREPEEDSEPESPNELRVPTFRNSASYHVKECKVDDK